MNLSLRRLTSDELIDVAKNYAGDVSQSNTVLQRMFEQY